MRFAARTEGTEANRRRTLPTWICWTWRVGPYIRAYSLNDANHIEHLFVFARAMTDHDASQRIVLSALLKAHPRLVGAHGLEAQLADVPRVREALGVLVQDGLATRLGDRVGCSREAHRATD